MGKVWIELLGPPLLTAISWLIAFIMARRQSDLRPMTPTQLWLLLLSAYAVFAMGLWGASFFGGHGSSALVQ